MDSGIRDISEKTTDVDAVDKATSDFNTGLLDDALQEDLQVALVG